MTATPLGVVGRSPTPASLQAGMGLATSHRMVAAGGLQAVLTSADLSPPPQHSQQDGWGEGRGGEAGVGVMGSGEWGCGGEVLDASCRICVSQASRLCWQPPATPKCSREVLVGVVTVHGPWAHRPPIRVLPAETPSWHLTPTRHPCSPLHWVRLEAEHPPRDRVPRPAIMGVQPGTHESPDAPQPIIAERGPIVAGAGQGNGADATDLPEPNSWRARRARCHDSFCTVVCSPGNWPQR